MPETSALVWNGSNDARQENAKPPRTKSRSRTSARRIPRRESGGGSNSSGRRSKSPPPVEIDSDSMYASYNAEPDDLDLEDDDSDVVLPPPVVRPATVRPTARAAAGPVPSSRRSASSSGLIHISEKLDRVIDLLLDLQQKATKSPKYKVRTLHRPVINAEEDEQRQAEQELLQEQETEVQELRANTTATDRRRRDTLPSPHRSPQSSQLYRTIGAFIAFVLIGIMVLLIAELVLSRTAAG